MSHTSEDVVQPSSCDIVNSYDWDVRVARAICLAESSGNQNAVGDDYVINGLHAASCGLFQIRTLKGRPSCEELKDPSTNVAWAYKVSNNGTNWKPWSVFTNGKYKQYL